MPKKLSNGISNYETIVNDDYYYVDKTMYIEKIENFSNRNIMLLRPRKFGKSLFISTLNYYYDIFEKDKFEKLFGNTYIGKNPTNLRNSYYVLKFNFSGIDTSNTEETIKNFREKVVVGVNDFAKKYGIDFYIDSAQNAEMILRNIFSAFNFQIPNGKLYVLIDEYDHFANELLGFHTEDFKNLVSRQGKIRKWYEILKEGTETVVERIFITGVAPITLDSLTSGFNISKDLTRNARFNEIFGFTEEELINVMKSQELSEEEISKILPVMRENYDGYKFSMDADTRMYNSNMCLNFLSDYKDLGKIPDKLIDPNIASDYEKISNILLLYKGEDKEKVIEDSIDGVPIVSDITDKFNLAKEFSKQDMISMLFYVGYLTIDGASVRQVPMLKIPNKVMEDIYSKYFYNVLFKDSNIRINETDYDDMFLEIANDGKIDKMVSIVEEFLSDLSNRDFIGFNEKDVKFIIKFVANELGTAYLVKSEMEVKRKYIDLAIIPTDKAKEYYSVMLELKYLKKNEENRLQEKRLEAKNQLQEYKELDEIKNMEKLKCYTVVAVNDKLYVEEV